LKGFFDPSDALFSPKELVMALTGKKEEDLLLPQRAIFTFHKGFMERLRTTFKGRLIDAWRPLRRVYELNWAGSVVTLCPIGGPNVGILVEEFSAFGVREFILIGLCGGLRDVEIGDIVLATGAIREEGLSYHYLKDAQTVVYSEWAEEWSGPLAQYRIKEGLVLTTDALYRETKRKTEAYRREGAIAVDMETASFYAVCRFRGLKGLALLAVSDVLKEEAWVPGLFSSHLQKALERLRDPILLHLLRGVP
jgi:uridine phosphorylase